MRKFYVIGLTLAILGSAFAAQESSVNPGTMDTTVKPVKEAAAQEMPATHSSDGEKVVPVSKPEPVAEVQADDSARLTNQTRNQTVVVPETVRTDISGDERQVVKPAAQAADPRVQQANASSSRVEGDTCAEAYIVPALPYNTVATTTDNTDTGGQASPDEWYKFTATVEGLYYISLCGPATNFDTYLWLFQDDCLTEVTHNDDECGLYSEIAVILTPGDYVASVEGYSSSGDYELDIWYQEPCDLTCPPEGIVDTEPNCADEYVDVTNGGCDSTPPVFGALTCGDTICGTSGTFLVGGASTRDTDWYLFDVTVLSTVTWTVTAEFDSYIKLVNVTPDCLTNTTIAYAYGNYCQPMSVASVLDVGQYAVYVAPYSAYDVVPCDADWIGTLTCEPWVPSPGYDCTIPIPVTLPAALPYSDLGQTTCGMIDNYADTDLGSYDGGEDIIYEITVTAGVTVDITLDPGPTTYTGIGLFNDCPDVVGSMLASSTYYSGAPHGMAGLGLNPGTYWIMIDTWPSPDCIPAFDLTITASTCDVVCPPGGIDEMEPVCYDDYVDGTNGGCNSDPVVFGAVNCGETICGTGGTFMIDDTTFGRDTDWFLFTLTEMSEVTLSGSAEFDLMLAIVGGVPDCTAPTILSDAYSAPCDTATLVTHLDVGTYAVFAATQYFTLVNCGAEYWATLTCVPWSPVEGDFCINPFLVTVPGTWIGNTADNTDSYGNPAPDEWYQFTLDAAYQVTLELCGPETDFDTYLRLVDVDCATQIAYDDDGPLCEEDTATNEPSEIILELEAGTYNVCVDGYSSYSGNYHLDIHLADPCVVTCPPGGTLEGEPDCYDEYVDATNGGCNSDPDVFGAISNGETICGTGGTFLAGGSNTRDTDWYLFTLTELSEVVFTGEAEFPLQLSIVSGVDDCLTPVIEGSATGAACEITTATVILNAGNYAAFVAPNTYSGVPCGKPYYATITWELYVPPDGDTIETALPLVLDECVQGTTVGFVDDYDEVCPYSGSTSPDVVYTFDLAELTSITFDLCNADYDSKIYVYNSLLELMGCNDDHTGQCEISFRSWLHIINMDPDTYYVVVDGYYGASGTYELCTITSEPCVVTCPPGSTPEGEEDCFDEYVDVTNGGCNSTPYVFGAIANGETVCGTAGTFVAGGNNSRDTDWFLFTVTETSEVTLTGEAEFDLQLLIISGVPDCITTVTEGSATGGACVITTAMAVVDAGTYAAWVGPSVFTGVPCGAPYYVTLSHGPWVPPVGDSCADPLVAPCLPYQTFSTTTNNTDTYGSASPDEWTRFTLDVDADVSISLCGGGTDYDSYLRLLDETCTTELAYNDDYCGAQSQIDISLVAGTYVICVEGWSSYSGNYQLDITVPPPVVSIAYVAGAANLTISGGAGAASFDIYKSTVPYDDGVDPLEFIWVANIPNLPGVDDVWMDVDTGNHFYLVKAFCP